jgi:hypothetical protein
MKMRAWFTQHKMMVQLSAFVLMVLAPVGMYLAVQIGLHTVVWGLVGVVAAGNLAVLLSG